MAETLKDDAGLGSSLLTWSAPSAPAPWSPQSTAQVSFYQQVKRGHSFALFQ